LIVPQISLCEGPYGSRVNACLPLLQLRPEFLRGPSDETPHVMNSSVTDPLVTVPKPVEHVFVLHCLFDEIDGDYASSRLCI